MILDFETLEAAQCYKLMSNSIFPRPIAWIVTEKDGILNLAPFSYFAPLSSKPAVVVVSIGKKVDGSPKDTFANILSTKKAAICIPHPSHANSISKSAISLPSNESECEAFDIPTIRVKSHFPPIVKGAQAAFFATFRETYPIEGSSTVPVLLNLKSAYFENGVIDERSNIMMEALGRVGNYFLIEGKRIEA